MSDRSSSTLERRSDAASSPYRHRGSRTSGAAACSGQSLAIALSIRSAAFWTTASATSRRSVFRGTDTCVGSADDPYCASASRASAIAMATLRHAPERYLPGATFVIGID